MQTDNEPEEDSNVVAFGDAKDKYNYQALLRGYQEIFESKQQELSEFYPHDVFSFAQVLEEAQQFMTQVNDKKGWSQASAAGLKEMEKMCVEMDEILQTHARFLDRRKILDVGHRLLTREHLGKFKATEAPIDLEETRKHRGAGLR